MTCVTPVILHVDIYCLPVGFDFCHVYTKLVLEQVDKTILNDYGLVCVSKFKQFIGF